ncbi:ApaG domain [Roseibacillus persicicus]|uniref:ApaG domain-containing protein n=1 Tax=Roseibacillus persicicus TaxID=454148 RepID=UPI00280F3DB8|nr:ApaG domain [Roseibacillus persicicus]MDQ8190433.1 ApaG domain [Roseibacillus persicicus]
MDEQWQELKGLSVQVSEVLYVPTLEAPEEKPHPFVYFVDITNDSDEQVTLHGRKWVVREHNGETTVLEGDGIVGQRPVLPPKDRYSYNSYHVLAGSGTACGAFYGVTDSGRRVFVAIPEFGMAVPDWV